MKNADDKFSETLAMVGCILIVCALGLAMFYGATN